MRVYLCRHAHADPGDPDELRPLSARGAAEANALADVLAASSPPPAAVLSSPLLRARQTAESIGAAVGIDVRVEPALAPGATADALRAALATLDANAVATVGHQPDCSELALALAGHDPGFPPGRSFSLDVET